MTSPTTELSSLWAVHSTIENRPAFRDWRRSRAEAEARIAELKASDDPPQERYWVTQLTREQVDAFKRAGFVPRDA